MSKRNKDDYRGRRYKRWRDAVLLKGNYRCSLCGSTNELTADHILPRVSHPELMLDVNNGRVLCEKCRVPDMLNSYIEGKFKIKPRRSPPPEEEKIIRVIKSGIVGY